MTDISPQDLKAKLDRHEPLVLLDVRDDWETALCRLDNATHIPTEEIEFRTAELDPADEIIVYATMGCGVPRWPTFSASRDSRR
jgi:rhodanese-related sulfurtransferase